VDHIAVPVKAGRDYVTYQQEKNRIGITSLSPQGSKMPLSTAVLGSKDNNEDEIYAIKDPTGLSLLA
jgi:hypothetical protein